MNKMASELVGLARELVSSTSGFMSAYQSKTHNNPFSPEMRVWSYATKDGEPLPMIQTEMTARKWNGEDVIWLNAIFSPEKQGTGMASHVLKKITNLADKSKVPIYLSPKSFGTIGNKLSDSALKSWYKRNGWKSEGGGTMVRSPH